MSDDYFSLGSLFEDQHSDRLKHVRARDCLAAIQISRDFELIGIGVSTDGDCDMIVVDCVNEYVASHGPSGIRPRERLAIVFEPPEHGRAPEVRMLRTSFPRAIPHLNHRPEEEPASLCLYFEPWSSVGRRWTPQSFLRRILWWLKQTSTGSLHQADQPPEALYIEGASGCEIILPPDFAERVVSGGFSLGLELVSDPCRKPQVWMARYVSQHPSEAFMHGLVPLVLNLDPIIQDAALPLPSNLGRLSDHFAARGVSILDALTSSIHHIVPKTGIPATSQAHSLIILPIQIQPAAGAPVHRINFLAFIVEVAIGVLGQRCGALFNLHGNFCCFERLTGEESASAPPDWRDLTIHPADIRLAFNRESANKACGLQPEESSFHGILAGVGSLGGTLADLWAKASWGNWTLVDPDYIKPHNIARHLAHHRDVGKTKVDVVKQAMEANYESGYSSVRTYLKDISTALQGNLIEGSTPVSLIVDATTSLEAPRDLSVNEMVPRCASVFFTPSGKGAVLLLENTDRSIRLDALEAQYYRSLLKNQWGEHLLAAANGRMWVGAGCRDISSIIPNEDVHLLAALLAGQIRRQKKEDLPKIGVWLLNEANDELEVHWVPVSPVIQLRSSDGWTVMLDEEIHASLLATRSSRLPNETGGVIVGYVDQILKRIYVVDVFLPPPDSQEEPCGFIRGCEGLPEAMELVSTRTAHVVEYVGDWHSHPQGASAKPSNLDTCLLEEMRLYQSAEGMPVVMIIVSDQEVRVFINNTSNECLPIR